MRQPTSKGCSRLSSTPKPPPEPGREWVFLCSVSPSRVRSWQSTVSSPDAILGGGPPSVSPPALSDAPFPAHRLQGPPGSRAAPQRAAAGALFRDGTFRALTQLRSRGGADAARHPQHRLWAAPGSPPLEATYVRRGPHRLSPSPAPFAPPPPGYGPREGPGARAPHPGQQGGPPGQMAGPGGHSRGGWRRMALTCYAMAPARHGAARREREELPRAGAYGRPGRY